MAVHRLVGLDLWRPGYQGAVVTVYIAGTTSLASLFTDEALTVAAANPQTLLTGTINGVTAGKLTAPLYTASPYTLSIDTGDVTGVERPPLTSLAAEDASAATVTVPTSSVSTALSAIQARRVYAADWGVIGSVAATNNTTLTAAIGALPSGGGRVILPPGTIPFTDLNLGAGVVLEGAGRGATTMTCQTGGNCVTLSGDRAGFARLTLDGINKVASSVGIFTKANDRLVFDDVMVQNFEVGLHAKGGQSFDWRLFFIDACSTGAKLHGDIDSGGGADGDVFAHLLWVGGNVTNCTVIGVDFSYEDRQVYNNVIRAVGINNNTGTGVNINGARHTKLEDCDISGNTTDMAVNDDSDTTVTDNTVIGLLIQKTRINGGAITFEGTCLDIIFDRTNLIDVDFTLTAPDNNILLLDSFEDALVTVSGTGAERLIRRREINHGASAGTTTDNVATVAWSLTLDPGQIVYLEAKVIGKQSNAEGRTIRHIGCGAIREGSELAYDAQTANFTLGDTVTGGTSGATGRILADADGGATGTLTLDNIIGAFENNELVTGALGGSADANGTLTGQNAVLDTPANVDLRTAYETNANYQVAFAVSAADVELHVTGDTGENMEWSVEVSVTST